MIKLSALIVIFVASTSLASPSKSTVFTQISSDSGVCAITDQGALYCSDKSIMADRIRSNIRHGGDTVADFSGFEKFILLSDYTLCGLRGGKLLCGGHRNAFSNQPASPFSGLNIPYLAITNIWGGAGGLVVKYADGQLGYVGASAYYNDKVEELTSNYKKFASKIVWTTETYASNNIACGLKADGSVDCIGRRNLPTNLPQGSKPFPDWSMVQNVVGLSAGGYEICMATKQNIRCYDKRTGQEYTVELKNTVQLVSAYNGQDICLDPVRCIPNFDSSRHCALNNAGHVSCWYAERSYLQWVDSGSNLKFETLSDATSQNNICGLSGGQPYCYFKKDDWQKVALVPVK